MRGAAIILLFTACAEATWPPRVGPPAPVVADRAAEERYQLVLARWTRRAELYDGFDSRLFVAAALETMELREAKASRLALFKALAPAEAEPLIAAERAAHAQVLSVTMGVHANERRFDDFASTGSIWRVALVSRTGEAQPVAIVRLPRPDASMRGLYPFLETFWTAYRIDFPRSFPNGTQVLAQEPGKVLLRLSSALGKIELTWELSAPGARGAAWP
jgi:hypothetical protein